MKQFKKKIMGLLLLIYMIAAIFILALLNFSYVQNNKNSISRILNMKFQIVSDQNGNKQEEVPKEQERISGARSEKVTVTEQKEDSYVKKSYLVAKAEDGTLYVKNMLPDTGFSEEEIIETAEKFLETKKTSGSYENYQFEYIIEAIDDIQTVVSKDGIHVLISYHHVYLFEDEKKMIQKTIPIIFIDAEIPPITTRCNTRCYERKEKEYGRLRL